MASNKTTVVEHLFSKYWDEETQTLTKSLISLSDVADAIRECNPRFKRALSDRNPANFMKDLMRGGNASKNWPKSIAEKRFTAVQRTGSGYAFEFIPYRENQTEPFPDEFKVDFEAKHYPIQSISLPLIAKSLGRTDETWLVQTAINLRVVETHFAVAAAFPLLELAHLQMGIKLRQTEIDALFLGRSGSVEHNVQVLVTCEAKHYNDPIIPQQIINQVQAAFGETQANIVVPIGLRAVKDVGFYLTEFQAVRREDSQQLNTLRRTSHAIYQLLPPVKGI